MIYHITIPVDSVNGFQIWQVEANSEEEAIQMFQNGEGEFLDEEVEVESLDMDNLEIEEIEEN